MQMFASPSYPSPRGEGSRLRQLEAAFFLETTTITAQSLKGKNYLMKVFDVMGKVVGNWQGAISNGQIKEALNMQGFAKGMYVIRVETEMERLVGKVVR